MLWTAEFLAEPTDTAQRASCQALGGVRSSFNFVISSAAWQTCFDQHGPKATGHSSRNDFILGVLSD